MCTGEVGRRGIISTMVVEMARRIEADTETLRVLIEAKGNSASLATC